MNAPFTPPVTICPPGKRAVGVTRTAVSSPIMLTTDTALPPSKRTGSPFFLSAKGDRRSAQERVEEAERSDAVSIAMSQPDRRDAKLSPDARKDAVRAAQETVRLHEPLGRFVARQWPRDADWADSMYRAGCAYDEIVRDSLIVMGLPYIGQSDGEKGEPLTDAQLQARKEVALARRKRADELLLRVDTRCARAMEALCYDKREPNPYAEGYLRNGLYSLADWLRIIKRGVDEGME